MQSIKPTKGKNKTNHDREEPRLQVLGEGGGKRFYFLFFIFLRLIQSQLNLNTSMCLFHN